MTEFYAFASAHPVLTFFLAYIMYSVIVDVAKVIKGVK